MKVDGPGYSRYVVSTAFRWAHVGWIGVDMSRMLPYMIVWNPTGLHFDRDHHIHQP